MTASVDASHPVVQALDRLVERCLTAGPLRSRQLPEGHSPCARGQPDEEGWLDWEPVTRNDFGLLAPLEQALERPLPDALKAFYGRYWRHHLETRADEGHVSLLGAWNPADNDRLLENLLGHNQQQRRLFGLLRRYPQTLFFACTEPDSEYILSMDIDSQEILVERPGTRDWRVVAPDLAGFLDRLQPDPPAA